MSADEVLRARKQYKRLKLAYQAGRATLEDADEARRHYKKIKSRHNARCKLEDAPVAPAAKRVRKQRDPNRARSDAEKATDNILKGRQDRARELKAADPALKHKEAIAQAWAEYRAAKAPAEAK